MNGSTRLILVRMPLPPALPTTQAAVSSAASTGPPKMYEALLALDEIRVVRTTSFVRGSIAETMPSVTL